MISLGALFISSAFATPFSIQIDISGQNCTPTGLGTAICTSSGGNPPTGCVATANPTSLPSAGGSTALAVASCTPAPSSYTWRRDGTIIGTTASLSNSLPANPGPAAAVYGFQVTACNGGACAAFPIPQLSVSVAAPGAGGDCPGFVRTLRMTMNWAAPARIYTADAGGMGPNDAVVVQFTTGGGTSPSNNLPRIGGGEWDSNPSTRKAVLSATACDFGPQAYPGAVVSGTSVTIPFTVNNPNNFGYYPILQPNTTYYLNIMNPQNVACTDSGNCNMAIDLAHPGF